MDEAVRTDCFSALVTLHERLGTELQHLVPHPDLVDLEQSSDSGSDRDIRA